MKVLDIRLRGSDQGIYLRCGCRRLWRASLEASEARCPDCGCIGDLGALIDAWALTWPDGGEGSQ